MLLIELSKLNADAILGDFLVSRSRLLGHSEVVDFLSDVSREIFSSKNCRDYPDLMTFGYFCRKSSIIIR